MVVGVCNHETAAHVHIAEPSVSTQYNNPMVWIYSNLAVTLISACGVLGLAVIPIMQKWFYQPLLQFLVALAVGTLAGDALLHLLPHAMSPRHNHDEQEAHIHTHGHGDNSQHDENMWKGFVAMLGLIFFFLMERIILFVAKWRKGRQLSKVRLCTQVNVFHLRFFIFCYTFLLFRITLNFLKNRLLAEFMKKKVILKLLIS